MKNSSLFLISILISAGFSLSFKIQFPVQDESLPREMIRMALFTDKIQKNSQGYWEAALIKGTVMVYIPAGDFMMGSSRHEYGREPNEGPMHRVFSKGIWIGKYEVTQEIWNEVMVGGRLSPKEMQLPQAGISYDDIQSFLVKLNRETGLKYRLPTEAEWEKCCRSGNPMPQYDSLDTIAWHTGNSGGKAHAVGTKKPNRFGLFDMLGNVWEWCSDWYSEDYYRVSPYMNPTGPTRGKRRVVRGGGFLHGGNYLRSAHRNSQDPAKKKSYIGFRLVLDESL